MNEIQQLNQRIEYLEEVIHTLVLSDRFRINKLMQFDDGRNIQTGLTTGTMIGTASGTTVNAGSFVPGISYTIITVGTTDFTAIGASANTIGVVFTATGAGSGSGTAKGYGQKIGFFGATPTTQRPGVAVSAAGIHAALVSLGLITA